ncbi:MAG: hypothetical protein SPM09_02810 [Fibrobacter sp.]|uniref:hypothetical protein n=1 Tax=Fibrobacter sp. TaxID=35828 RepID=UPI002A914E68|nr:hypothetical protein [Fibrobacter sp.]MDY6263319.1 hypothetical protein [Fibrobacter sp.]
MDKDLLQKKLEMLANCIARIKSQKVETLEDLEANLDKQEIIILNLQRAVQICIDIGGSVGPVRTLGSKLRFCCENDPPALLGQAV